MSGREGADEGASARRELEHGGCSIGGDGAENMHSCIRRALRTR